MEASIECPYCGEPLDVQIDDGGAPALRQDLIEDCQVCCRPIRLLVSTDDDGEPALSVATLDE